MCSAWLLQKVRQEGFVQVTRLRRYKRLAGSLLQFLVSQGHPERQAGLGKKSMLHEEEGVSFEA